MYHDKKYRDNKYHDKKYQDNKYQDNSTKTKCIKRDKMYLSKYKIRQLVPALQHRLWYVILTDMFALHKPKSLCRLPHFAS